MYADLLGWSGRVALAVGLGVAVLERDADAAVTLLIFLLLSFVTWILSRYVPDFFDPLFTLAVLMNAALWLWDDRFFFLFDEIVHVVTPFTIALALGYLVYDHVGTSLDSQRVFFGLTIASFGITIGALWEITEWSATLATGQPVIGTLDDTIHDLIADVIGSVGASALLIFLLQRSLERYAERGRNGWDAEAEAPGVAGIR
jgi:uncharacterized membrane protein YjdF